MKLSKSLKSWQELLKETPPDYIVTNSNQQTVKWWVDEDTDNYILTKNFKTPPKAYLVQVGEENMERILQLNGKMVLASSSWEDILVRIDILKITED